jgi:hypothetical protein
LDEGVGMSDLCQKQTSCGFRFCATTGSQLHHSIRHKAFMSHSCRRSHCSSGSGVTQRKSHGVEEKEEELEIEDLKRTSLALGQRY